MNTAELSNQSHRPNNKSLWNSRITWLTALSALTVVVIYIFFISVGTWTKWPTTTDFYAELANAFDHGQVSLLTKPDPSILALQNPYQYDEPRKKANYIWDVSLFNGKYYIYWGPAPAIIMAIVGLFHPIKAAINTSSLPPPADYFLSTSCCSSGFGNASSPTCRCGHLKSSSCLWTGLASALESERSRNL